MAVQITSNPAGSHQSPNLPKPNKRSFTVGFAGMSFICLGLGIAVAGFVIGVWLIPLMLRDPSRTRVGALGQVAQTAGLWIPAALAICIGQPFVRIGCGLFERRNRCRIVTVVAGAVLLALAVLALFYGKSILGGVCAIWGVWWIAFFTNKSVRSQFGSSIKPAVESPRDNGSTFRIALFSAVLFAVGVSYINVIAAGIIAYATGIVFFVIPACLFLVKPLKPSVRGVRDWLRRG